MSSSLHAKNSNSGFALGFILGIAIGAVIVFLLVTKKGKRILRLLSDEGLEGLVELEDIFAQNLEQDKPIIKRVIKKQINRIIHSEPESPTKVASDPIVSQIPSTPVRRFFKGIPKRGKLL